VVVAAGCGRWAVCTVVTDTIAIAAADIAESLIATPSKDVNRHRTRDDPPHADVERRTWFGPR
jgi:hypothetical protein